jgi:hypothetical protein
MLSLAQLVLLSVRSPTPSPSKSPGGPFDVDLAGDVFPVLVGALAASLLTYWFAPWIEIRKERGRRDEEAGIAIRDAIEDVRNAIEEASRYRGNALGTYPALNNSAPPIIGRFLHESRRLFKWRARLVRRRLLALAGSTVVGVRRVGATGQVTGEELIVATDTEAQSKQLAKWLVDRSTNLSHTPLTPEGYTSMMEELSKLHDCLRVRRWRIAKRWKLRKTGMPKANKEMAELIEGR